MKHYIRRIFLFLMLLSGLTFNLHKGQLIVSVTTLYACDPDDSGWGDDDDDGGGGGGDSGDDDDDDDDDCGDDDDDDDCSCDDVCDPTCDNYAPSKCIMDPCNPNLSSYDADYCGTVCDPNSINYDEVECLKVCDPTSADYNPIFCDVCACGDDDDDDDDVSATASSVASGLLKSSALSTTTSTTSGCPLNLNDFDYTMDVAPVECNSRYAPMNWCTFLTLSTIRKGTPCAWVRAYCKLNQICVKTCWDHFGLNGTMTVFTFYNREGIILTQKSLQTTTTDEQCDMLNSIASGGKGILIVETTHVWLIYGFHRHTSDPQYNQYIQYTIDKYDTNDSSGWNRQGIAPIAVDYDNTYIVKQFF